MEGIKMKTNSPEYIDLRLVFKMIWCKRLLFYKVLPITFVLSCIYIVSIPRYYTSEIKLAPEMGNSKTGGTLSDLASSFGIDLKKMQTSDAITPLLYPDLIEDNGFVASIVNIQVKSQDGKINTTYHDYLAYHEKETWWSYPITWLIDQLNRDEVADGAYDPYNLTQSEDLVLKKARENINIEINKKTGVISISTESQDPLISKTLADSIKDKLQIFITRYRTNKARIDYEYYKKLEVGARQDYEKVQSQYASMADASTNPRLRSTVLKMEDVEKDMQLKFNAYSLINTQLQAAKAKVQEDTPAFTVLKGAAVPVKPTGPKRMLFVLGMVLLAFIVVSLYAIRQLIFSE